MRERHSGFRTTLPTKIAGLAFWGMALVGLLVSVFLLHARETDLIARNQERSATTARLLEQILQTRIADDTGKLRQSLAQMLKQGDFGRGVEALVFDYRGEHIQIGQQNAAQDVHNELIHLGANPGQRAPNDLNLEIRLPELRQTLTEMHKNVLMTVGSMVFAFGLILQKILQRVLSRPFINMVRSANSFARGDNTVRFDERRSDEFGQLGQFINRALNAVMQQHQELEFSRLALYQEKERVEVTLRSITDGVISTDAAMRVIYLNPVAERLCGVGREQAVGRNLNDLVHFHDEETGEARPDPVGDCLQGRAIVTLAGRNKLVRPDGSATSIAASAALMRSDTDEIVGAVLVLQDVSESRLLTRQLSYQASHDALTDLHNRRSFEEELNAMLRLASNENRQHALCYIDLDQFKIVNDTCGHMAGDELLRQLAISLRTCVREGDFLARLGGDEFGVLLENCPLPRAVEIANKIIERVRETRFAWNGTIFPIGASIGVAPINADTVDANSVMAAADLACYFAKDAGRNRVHVYEPTDAALTEHHGQMFWAGHIVKALEEQRFVLFRQPLVALGPDHVVEHWEILLRMRDENGGLILPSAFIPAAERYNQMERLDRWIIEQVFTRLASVKGDGRRQLIAINLSGNSLGDDTLLPWIQQLGHSQQIDFTQICFEITETAAISNLDRAVHFMTELRREGCRFALDDFGSGLSSFAYLKRLPVNFIKIDGAFVKDMTRDLVDRVMVEAITRVGRVMQIQSIAEWVEDEETYILLREIGVNFVQGDFIGRPEEVPALPARIPKSSVLPFPARK